MLPKYVSVHNEYQRAHFLVAVDGIDVTMRCIEAHADQGWALCLTDPPMVDPTTMDGPAKELLTGRVTITPRYDGPYRLFIVEELQLRLPRGRPFWLTRIDTLVDDEWDRRVPAFQQVDTRWELDGEPISTVLAESLAFRFGVEVLDVKSTIIHGVPQEVPVGR